MGHFLRKMVLFGFFAVIFYVPMLIVFGDWVGPSFLKKNLNYKLGLYGHMHSRVNEVIGHDNVDIVFLGSSKAYRGFDPRIFVKSGLKTFNLGSSSQTPIQTDILICRYIDRLSPKLVVYEVNPDIFASDGVESGLDLMANDIIDRHITDMVFSINNIKTYNGYIYSAYKKLLSHDKDYQEDSIKDGDQYVSGGYVERLQINKIELSQMPKNDRDFNYQWEAFDNILARLEAKGIQVMLVHAPVTKNYRIRYEDLEFFDQKMNSMATYFDYSYLNFLSDEAHFYDDQHLNQNGVKLFNNYIISVIEFQYLGLFK